jgi:hypothetical protein
MDMGIDVNQVLQLGHIVNRRCLKDARRVAVVCKTSKQLGTIGHDDFLCSAIVTSVLEFYNFLELDLH